MKIPFATQSYMSYGRPISSQRLVNMYVENEPVDARTQIAVFGTPGLKPTGIEGDGACRGMLFAKGILYFVLGEKFYSRIQSGFQINYTGVIPGTGPLTMASNNLQIGISDGTTYYVADPATGMVSSGLAAAWVTAFDGYVIYGVPNTSEFGWADLDNAGSIDPLNVGSIEGTAQLLVRGIVNHRALWLMGDTGGEIWTDTGDPNLPFTPITGIYLEKGLLATLGICKADNNLYWLGNDRIIYGSNGYQPQRVSTFGIESELEKLTNPQDCWAWSYSQLGHTFVVFTFITDKRTFVYDAATKRWHERQSINCA